MTSFQSFYRYIKSYQFKILFHSTSKGFKSLAVHLIKYCLRVIRVSEGGICFSSQVQLMQCIKHVLQIIFVSYFSNDCATINILRCIQDSFLDNQSSFSFAKQIVHKIYYATIVELAIIRGISFPCIHYRSHKNKICQQNDTFYVSDICPKKYTVTIVC